MQLKHVQAVGRLALILVEKWGMVACIDDGEDGAGRHMTRLMTPVELVERACATAEVMWEQIEKRGWALDVPAPTLPEIKTSEQQGFSNDGN